MLTRRQRLRFWLHEARMPKEQRRTARAERRGDMTHVSEEKVANLGRAEGEGHYSRSADFHRN
jgi:hypothetical protein